MALPFWKLSATGNDFVVVDHREPFLKEETLPEFAAKACDRHFGVGADGLLLLENDLDTTFRMRYLNADGSHAAMCGNGGRALAWYARSLDLWAGEADFVADDGLHTMFENGDRLGVTLNVNPDIREIQLDNGQTGWFLNTGVPHLVFFSEHLEDENVQNLGSRYRYDEQFQPEGTNVNFIEIDEGVLRIRTYERGVEDETLACSTGMLAAAVVAVERNMLRVPISVRPHGGYIEVTERGGEWILWGTVDRVFSGELILNETVQDYLK